MSLIFDLARLQESASRMADKALRQQMIYRRLIDELVAWRMYCRRELNDYETADKIRSLLHGVGVAITDGAGPNQPSPGNRQTDDTWELKQ